MGEKLPQEFEDLEIELPGDAADPRVNSAAHLSGLTDFQRFVAKNFFDTQKDRRASYLKRLGYEMKPGDPEQYRPLGSDGNYQPIEPDNSGFAGYIPILDLFDPEKRKNFLQNTQAGLAEFSKDVNDFAFDIPAGEAIAAASAATGAKSFAAAAPAGKKVAALAGIAGVAAGGSAAYAGAEVAKKAFGDYFLDETVPLDLQELAYQSFAAGGFAVGGKAVGAALNKWKAMGAKKAQAAIKEMTARKAQNTMTPELAADFVQNPEKYTPEAVEGSTKKLLKMQDELFGTSVENPKSTRELTGGIAKEAIEPLNKQADLEIEKLAYNRDADSSVEDVVGIIQDRLKPLTEKTFKSAEEERTISFFADEVERLKKAQRISDPGVEGTLDPATGFIVGGREATESFKPLNFKETRDILKGLQNSVYDTGGKVYQNGTAKQITHGLKELADAKAGTLGSDLPKINARRSEILNTYKNMRAIIKDGTMQAAYTGTKGSVVKERAQAVFEEAGRVLNMPEIPLQAQDLQFQKVIEDIYNTPANFGSGGQIAEGVKSGFKQGVKEAFAMGTAGSVVGLPREAAAIGFVHGAASGFKKGQFFSSPKTLSNKNLAAANTLRALNADATIASAARKGSIPLAAQLSQQSPQLADYGRQLMGKPPTGQVTPLRPEPEAAPVQQPQPGGGPAQSVPAKFELPPEFQDMEIELP